MYASSSHLVLVERVLQNWGRPTCLVCSRAFLSPLGTGLAVSRQGDVAAAYENTTVDLWRSKSESKGTSAVFGVTQLHTAPPATLCLSEDRHVGK